MFHWMIFFWQRLSFSDQGLCETQVTIIEEMETISKCFEQLDVCGKVHLKSKLREIVYPDMNSMCPPRKKGEDQGCSKKTVDQTTKVNQNQYRDRIFQCLINFIIASRILLKTLFMSKWMVIMVIGQ